MNETKRSLQSQDAHNAQDDYTTHLGVLLKERITQALLFINLFYLQLYKKMNILKFTPFNSSVDASFWQSLVEKKLNVLKLSSESQVIQGHYTNATIATNEKNETINIPSRFHIPAEGLEGESHMFVFIFSCCLYFALISLIERWGIIVIKEHWLIQILLRNFARLIRTNCFNK